MENWKEVLVYIGRAFISVIAAFTGSYYPMNAQDARKRKVRTIRGGKK